MTKQWSISVVALAMRIRFRNMLEGRLVLLFDDFLESGDVLVPGNIYNEDLAYRLEADERQCSIGQ